MQTVEETFPSMFKVTDLNGYDYVKSLINIPVYLEGSRFYLEKLSIMTAKEMQEATLRSKSSARILSSSISSVRLIIFI